MWNQTNQMINYSELYYYEQQDGSQPFESSEDNGTPTIFDANITTFNMGAWSTWHQMNAREQYWLAWQGI